MTTRSPIGECICDYQLALRSGPRAKLPTRRLGGAEQAAVAGQTCAKSWFRMLARAQACGPNQSICSRRFVLGDTGEWN